VCLYETSGDDFAGDTIAIVHRDRKVEVAPNWATVYFQKGHPKQRAGVRTPWTPSVDPPLVDITQQLLLLLLFFGGGGKFYVDTRGKSISQKKPKKNPQGLFQ